ncbi:MAG: DUF4184 family protein [Methanomassiliicoccales archaeon]|nr:MAG: DUF4184 family protein [Methanomassiliicoccales archaeon]
MPLTPAHVGPALLIGAIAGRKLNLIVLITATILIDVEVLVLGFIRGLFLYHGFLHTFWGATIFGLVYGTILFIVFQIYWGGKDVYYGDSEPYRKLKEWRNHNWMYSYKCVVISAIIGAYSHIALDWLLYEDIRLFAFTSANMYHDFVTPFFSATILGIYLFCAGSFVIGLFLYVYRWIFSLNKWYKTSSLYDIKLHKKDLWALMAIGLTPFAISAIVIFLVAFIVLIFNPDNTINSVNLMVRKGYVLLFGISFILIMIYGYSWALEKANWNLFE